MAQFISSESKQLSKLPTDIDRFRRKFFIKENGFAINIASPYIAGYEKNYYYLLKHSNLIFLEQKYYKRPDYLSRDQYGTITLWPVILFVNDITCIENFALENVYIPDYFALVEMTRNHLSNLSVVDLEEEWKFPQRDQPKLFSPQYRGDITDFESGEDDEEETVEDQDMYYIREPFVLDEIDIYNGGLELGFVPEESSLIMSIGNKSITPLYDIHYKLIKNQSDELKFVSWNPQDVSQGLNELEVNDKIEFIYAKKQ